MNLMAPIWKFRTKSRSRLQGFTLVELLVVIAIVVFLAGLLMPVISDAKRQARQAQCVSNLRQLGIALHLYVEEGNQYPLITVDGISGAWEGALRSLVPDNIFYCPLEVVPAANFVNTFQLTGGPINPHYGYNAIGAVWMGTPPCNLGLGGDINALTDSRQATSGNRVVTPARMIAIGDSRTYIETMFGIQPQTNIPDLLYITYPYVMPPYGYIGVNNSHGGAANMVFCDAHVESSQQSLWIAATDQRRRLWNNDNQPHPEYW